MRPTEAVRLEEKVLSQRELVRLADVTLEPCQTLLGTNRVCSNSLR